jgi:hypothetical protein
MKFKFTASLLALALAGMVGAADDASACGTTVAGTIAVDTTWGGAANPGPICMSNAVFVNGGATLTILPGTIVRGFPRSGPVVPGVTAGTPGALIVTQDGYLDALASATNPSIMTTAAVDNDDDGVADDLDGDGFLDTYPGFDPADCPGACALVGPGLFLDDAPTSAPLAPLNTAGAGNLSLWGGLVLLGNAPTNLSDLCGTPYGTCVVEGLTIPGFPVADATYGGSNPHDSSGRLSYVSVRHAGDELGAGNELNGITLAGVGDGTQFDHIEVYVNFDDGMEWFGGTVDGSFLHVAFAGDDTFDVDQGYVGVNQFVFGVMPFFNENSGADFGSGSGDKAGEFDGDDFAERGGDVNIRQRVDTAVDDFLCWPFHNPNFWNMTVIGSTPDAGQDFVPVGGTPGGNRGLQFRNGYAGRVFNSIVVNTGAGLGIDVDSDVGDGCPGSDSTVNANNGDTRAFLPSIAVVSTTLDDGGALGADELAVIANGDAVAGELGGTANTVNSLLFPGLVNEDVTFDPTGNAAGKLDPSLKAVPADPRVGFGLAGTAGGVPARGAGLDPAATYRGAFDPSAPVNWTSGWTTLSIGGILAD